MRLRLLEDVAATSTDHEALTAWLASRCQHVAVDDRLGSLGYRFYAMGPADVPSFFCHRFVAGARQAAVTLLGGIDPVTGDGVADDCVDSATALARISEGLGGLWSLRVTYGARMLDLGDIASFLRNRDPEAFDRIAGELFALGVAARDACPFCARSDGEEEAS